MIIATTFIEGYPLRMIWRLCGLPGAHITTDQSPGGGAESNRRTRQALEACS